MALESSTQPSASPGASPAEPLPVQGSASPFKILFAASEAAPFAKTGGLADVVGSLPRALAERGHQCVVMLPLYSSARAAHQPLQPTEHVFEIPIGNRQLVGRLWESHLPASDVRVVLVEQREYYERDDPAAGKGLYQYQLPNGRLRDYPDNIQRFIFFSRAVLEALPLIGFWPDVLHCNDWQTGLVPAYLRELYGKNDADYAGVRSLFTIHNLAYQGLFWHWDMALTGLDWGLFNWRQLEFYGHLNLMKGGINFADAISTVSRRYAEEIQTTEYGCGLEGVLRHHRDKLTGIVNGVNYGDWDPATDSRIPTRYNTEDAESGKAVCKAALQRRLKLPVDPDVPLLGMISRLVEQKGLDLLIAVSSELLALDVQLVVLGLGDALYQQGLRSLMAKHPQKVAAIFGFDETLAHQIEAGADIFLMPSRFEPSGLNQLYSLKYGTVPVARDTGGLSDTVTDATPETLAAGTATGFMFKEYMPEAFLTALRRALQCYREERKVWRQLQRTGMTQDWSWSRRAAEYEVLYSRLKVTRTDV